MKKKRKSSQLCRDAMWFLRTTSLDYAAGRSGQTSGICGAIHYVSYPMGHTNYYLKPYEVFDILGFVVADWRKDNYLLPPLLLCSPRSREQQEAYSARIMLLELAALLFEEQGD